jgi:hypothetical protein
MKNTHTLYHWIRVPTCTKFDGVRSQDSLHNYGACNSWLESIPMSKHGVTSSYICSLVQQRYLETPIYYMQLPKGPNYHGGSSTVGMVEGVGPWELNSLPNYGACNSCLEAFLMYKHENSVIILFVCSRNLWKTPTHEMSLHKGPNLHHIWWWEPQQSA